MASTLQEDEGCKHGHRCQPAQSGTPGGGDDGATNGSADRAGRCGGYSRAVAVAELQERWVQARLRVLLVGEAKRGKSTVGNAILRRQVLPTGVLPLTAVATTVRAGTPERIEISHHDGGVR